MFFFFISLIPLLLWFFMIHLFSYPTLPPHGSVISFRPQLFKGWIVLCKSKFTINFNNCIAKWRLCAWDIWNFHYWQPALRQRLHRWLANSGKWRRGGRGDCLTLNTNCSFFPPHRQISSTTQRTTNLIRAQVYKQHHWQHYCWPHSLPVVNSDSWNSFNLIEIG